MHLDIFYCARFVLLFVCLLLGPVVYCVSSLLMQHFHPSKVWNFIILCPRHGAGKPPSSLYPPPVLSYTLVLTQSEPCEEPSVFFPHPSH